MKTYRVSMTVTISSTIDKEVEAESKSEAIELAKEYEEDDIIDQIDKDFTDIEIEEIEE